MAIAILTPVLEPGDAVSNDVIGMHKALKDLGYDAEIFATHSSVADCDVLPVGTLPGTLKRADDVLIYHFSVGWELGLQLLEKLPCRKLVKYHNVTPPEYYDGVNSDYANVCRTGRRMLQAIANAPVDLYLSDSAYNSNELIEAGADPARQSVVPPFHHIDQLLAANADLRTLDMLRDGKVNVLMVGRLAPNKGHIALVDAFAHYHAEFEPLSRLLIVGKHDARLSIYIDAVRQAIDDAHLGDAVLFTQRVSTEELKAYFLSAHAFAIASEHEGFCVPLVEAMAHHVPVIAYSSTAISETAAGAAIVWPERNPMLFAAAIDEVVTGAKTSDTLGQCGWARYTAQFSNRVIRSQFVEAVAPFLR